MSLGSIRWVFHASASSPARVGWVDVDPRTWLEKQEHIVDVDPRTWLQKQERIVDVDPRTWLEKQERIVRIDPRPTWMDEQDKKISLDPQPAPDKREPTWRRGLLEKLERPRAEQQQAEKRRTLPIMKRGPKGITD